MIKDAGLGSREESQDYGPVDNNNNEIVAEDAHENHTHDPREPGRDRIDWYIYIYI